MLGETRDEVYKQTTERNLVSSMSRQCPRFSDNSIEIYCNGGCLRRDQTRSDTSQAFKERLLALLTIRIKQLVAQEGSGNLYLTFNVLASNEHPSSSSTATSCDVTCFCTVSRQTWFESWASALKLTLFSQHLSCSPRAPGLPVWLDREKFCEGGIAFSTGGGGVSLIYYLLFIIFITHSIP